MVENLLEGLTLLLRVDTFLMTGFGLMLGMTVGALPGFTTVMAMAIVLPVSFFMEPLVGIPFLIGVYKGGIYGGSIPAILINVPGTGASVATTFDGPALTKKGQSRKALDMALFSSVIGDLSSDVFTILMMAPLAALALLVGPPELAAIVLFSLIIISGTTHGVFVKGLIMCTFGIFLSMIGQDPLGGMSRFTFGFFQLKSGIPLLPLLIGLFALPEILSAVGDKTTAYIAGDKSVIKGSRLAWRELKRCTKTIFRSTGIGISLGMVPGVGQVVAAFVGYAAAKKRSKHPETFGKGELEGIAAAESANNAVNGPTLVPLLTLGIPGDNVTAILLGAFVAQGMRPGPQLMVEQAPMMYAILVAMLLANVIFVVLGYLTIPFFARIVSIPKSALLPVTAVFAFAGSYVFRSDPFDLVLLVFFGIFGFIAKKLKFDVTPLVMGFILGPILEYSFGQTVNLAGGSMFSYIIWERPFAGIVFVLSIVAAVTIIWGNYKKTKKKPVDDIAKNQAAKEEGTSLAD